MKKFRLLAAMVITVAMLFTVALAADFSFEAVKYDGAADTLTVVVKAETSYTIDMYSGFQLKYDENVLAIDTEASKAATTAYAMTFYDYTGDMGYGAVAVSNEAGDIAVTKDSELMVVVFNVLDKTAVVGTEISWDEAGTFVYSVGESVNITGSVTVEAAKKDPETVKDMENIKDADKTAVEIDGVTYTNVALFEATLGSAEAYSEAGFYWMKDDVATENKYAVDANVISGGGTFEYTVAMYAIPGDVTIKAIPYYVTK